MAQEDKVEQLSNDIEMESEKQSEQVKKRKGLDGQFFTGTFRRRVT